MTLFSLAGHGPWHEAAAWGELKPEFQRRHGSSIKFQSIPSSHVKQRTIHVRSTRRGDKTFYGSTMVKQLRAYLTWLELPRD